jgi:hypothetical protein
VRFIAGIETTPVVITLDTTLPLMELMKPDAMIATLAAPPRNVPTSPSARSLKKEPAPVCCSAAPKMMKPMTSWPNARIGIPNELSSDTMW